MSPETKNRNAANKALAALPIYADGLQLTAIDQILTSNGFQPMQDGIYCGREGRVHEQVGEHTWFTMTWYKMEVSGKYELVAYVSGGK